ncbi:hypothetical protein A7P96_07120 [Eikenella sp. NML03-A-027]|uniref:DUF4376 domain-containing protein n=1 Tax=Eikenella sp. NML03-A-027 TaxID=1795828 RepID=UPI0007DE78B4|nr:DUF4376 domain-containing protein [Eikenella sp. NML03-A-027]OAM30370.1 hypothetical protein A7P96_07120 [Eikenella sp. NML03-A-027]
MTLYYSQSNGGFYDDQIHSRLPEDAVAISPEQHAELLAGQSNGQVIMPGKDGKPVLAERPPCPSSTWDGEQWHIDPECAARLKAEQQAEVWERIKAKRYDNLRHGVFVKSVGKWFQTDDASRTQYLALAVMPRLPEKLSWKTMDNSFVIMTKALLGELMEQMLIDEQADFANAERHKAAMLKAAHPLEYDYSDGWTANFDRQPAAELEEAQV